LIALFANSRRYAGEDTECASYRSETWRRLDPSRTGIIAAEEPARAYLDFALNAPVIARRTADGGYLRFPEWLLHDGLACAPDPLDDWRDHLSTLFPEVRPRGYFEVRSTDSLAPEQYAAPICFLIGLAYDADASAAAAELLGPPDAALLECAGRLGLADARIRAVAQELWALAMAGCRRQSRLVSPATVEEADAEGTALLAMDSPAGGR
jgi:glutamate--cysteine ligase